MTAGSNQKGMNMALKFRTTVLGAAAGLCMAGLVLTATMNQDVAAQATPAPEGIVWEYNTVSLEPASMQAKLTELGLDGWEVFAIVNSDLVLDQTNDSRPHLVTQRVEVTSKRARKK